MNKPLILFILLLIPSWLLSQNAPVTTAGRVTNAVPGNTSVPIPVTVTGFNNVGKFILTMLFDTTKVRYVSATTHSQLQGMSVNYTPPSGNTQGKIVLSWTGSDFTNVSLADSSSIADLVFHYVTGTGILYWSYTFGTICQYKRYVGNVLVLLSDTPKYNYYMNGGISNRTAPFVYVPSIADPVPGAVAVPVTVNSFTTISGFTLWLQYNPAIITYVSFTKNPAFGSAFTIGDNPGENGNRVLVVQWYAGLVTLANGSTLFTLNFSYPSANCNPSQLLWIDQGPSCEFTDNYNDVLIDMPQQTYYTEGIVASGLDPTWTGAASSDWSDSGNWNACGVPVIARKAIIPNVSPNPFPVVSSAASCKSLTVKSGATLTILQSGSVTIGDE